MEQEENLGPHIKSRAQTQDVWERGADKLGLRLGTHEHLNDVRCDGRLFVRTYL
jgi:hypothetical protein